MSELMWPVAECLDSPVRGDMLRLSGKLTCILQSETVCERNLVELKVHLSGLFARETVLIVEFDAFARRTFVVVILITTGEFGK